MDVEAWCAELAGSAQVEVATKRRRRRPNENTRGGHRHKSLRAKRVLQRAAEDEEYYGAKTVESLLRTGSSGEEATPSSESAALEDGSAAAAPPTLPWYSSYAAHLPPKELPAGADPRSWPGRLPDVYYSPINFMQAAVTPATPSRQATLTRAGAPPTIVSCLLLPRLAVRAHPCWLAHRSARDCTLNCARSRRSVVAGQPRYFF